MRRAIGGVPTQIPGKRPFPPIGNGLIPGIQRTELSLIEAVEGVAPDGAHLFPVTAPTVSAPPRGSKVVMSFFDLGPNVANTSGVIGRSISCRCHLALTSIIIH